jgi:hypothetical protein
MTGNAALKRDLGKVALALEENISDAEMDALLAGRREEIEALLEEAKRDEERGDEAPLEPLHEFLRRARKLSSPAAETAVTRRHDRSAHHSEAIGGRRSRRDLGLSGLRGFA